MTRDRVSRPNWSVPSQWAIDGGSRPSAQIRLHRIAGGDPGREDGDDIKGDEDDTEDEADAVRA